MSGNADNSVFSFHDHDKKYCAFAIQQLKTDKDANKELKECALRFYDTQSKHFLANEGNSIREPHIRKLILNTLHFDCLRVADDITKEVQGKEVGEPARSLLSDKSMLGLMRTSILVDYGMHKTIFVQMKEKGQVDVPSNPVSESSIPVKCKTDPTKEECANCSATDGAVKLFTCAKCKKVKYCGTACQTQHWKKGRHKRFCVAEGPERVPNVVFPNRGKCPKCSNDMTAQLMMLQCGCFVHIECLRKTKTKSCDTCAK